MFRMILAFAFGIGIFATPATAQQQNKTFITTQPCDEVGKMAAIVTDKYGEQPLFSGEGLQFSAQNGQPYKSSMMFFVNQDTSTWSLIALYPDGTGCMVANGRAFEPYMGPTF